MRTIPALVLLAAFIIPSLLAAQAVNIKGKVLTESGDPLPFATIIVKGTRVGVSSDKSGDFSIEVPRLPSMLQFSAVGYQNVEYKITTENSKAIIKVTMKQSTATLDEVVVTGHAATARKKEVAYATTSMSSPEMKTPGLEKAAHKGATYKTSTDRTGRSRILTAGELSDFKKWKLWGDYNDSEFRSFSNHWVMSFRKRYCVQVQNKDHRPVIGENVFLLDEDSRDTIWKTVTDNTGKAELWADEDPSIKEQANYNIVCANQSIRFPVLFENGINRITIKRGCDVPNTVDIAFVVDATGSMGDEIQYLQAEMQDIIDKTTSKYKEVNLRLASVFYRDRGDEYLTRTFNFQTDAGKLVNFIKQQSARGGGDFPEAVDVAMEVALDSLKWSSTARTKILFLVLDAPPHDADKEKMKILIRKAAATGVRIVPIACSGINKSTEYLLRCAALATNGSYVFLTDDSGVGNPHIKPTTDEFKVELLNELLQRLIGEMIYAPTCSKTARPEPIVKDTAETKVTVIVYPNPTRGRVTVESTGTIREIYVTDFTGKVLMKLEASKNKRRWQFQMGIYPSGTYLIKYFIEEKGWGAEKVILLH